MFQPIQSAIDNKSFSELARELLAAYPEMCKVRSKKAGNLTLMAFETLAARLGELDAGDKLLWWSKKPELVKCLVKHIGISRDDLALDRMLEPYIFKFVDAPDLPAIDLRRQDHWSIAKPQFVPIDGQNRALNYATRSAMGYWLSENNLTPNTSKIEWLQVTDDLELELLVGRFKVIEKNNYISCKSLKEIYSNEKSLSVLFNHTPLIISIEDVTETMDLSDLIKDRNEAPLMIVSRSSPPSDHRVNFKEKKDDREIINYWKWVYQDDWRCRLVRWFYQHLSDPRYSNEFAEKSVQDWLVEHDVNCQWFKTTRDVLSLCQIFSAHSGNKIKRLKSYNLGNDLLDLQQKRNESDRALLKKLIENRWKCWNVRLEGNLPSTTWIALSESVCDYEKLQKNKMIEVSSIGFNFKYPMVVRLILRDLLIEKIAQGEMHDWANACFCPERRPILDAALNASSIEVLTKITRALENVKNTVSFIGVVEALFIAFGRLIGKGLQHTKDVSNLIQEDVRRIIIDGVISKLNFEQGFPRPWSRPVNSQSEQIEWVSACWAWSLLPLPEGMSVPNTWLFPGWSTELSTDFPLWLVPRTQYDLDGSQECTDILGYAKNYEFIAIVENLLSKKQCDSITRTMNYLPEFLKIALLRQAAKGIYVVNLNWWHGVLGIPSIETAVLRNFVSPYTDGMKTPAMNIWPSLVKYLKSSFNPNTNDLPKHWGRWTSKTSPMFHWVMEQVKIDTRKALSVLDNEACKFLTSIPQRLDSSFNLELLKSMAQRLPSRDWLESYQAPGYLINFGADAVEGVIPFLQDEQLGDQAAYCLWNWAPDRAEDLLRHDNNLGVVAKRNLIFNCPHSGIAVAVDALKRDASIFDLNQCNTWVHLRLSNAGIYSDSLWKLIATV